jgi:L-asparaginase
MIAIVFTGGTISMAFDAASAGAVPRLTCEEIVARTPGLRDLAELRLVDFARLPGPHMTPARMFELAHVVEAQLADPDVTGVAVTHGTDTLEESAYLLDLRLNSEKPVAFLGAMRHSSELGWDGPANLMAAVRVAASPEARGLGVLVVMNQLVLSAADATKTNTLALGTFAGRDSGPLGVVEQDRVLVSRRRHRREHIPAPRLEERVEIVKFAAGSDGRLLRLLLDDGLRGLVIEGLGCGNVPITVLPEVERAIASRIPVVLTSRCAAGRVLDSYAYAGAARPLRQVGAILGGSLPSHKARLKLMVLLGAGAELQTIRESFEGQP